MKTLVFQSDDRPLSQPGHHALCSQINQIYCENKNYDYKYVVVYPTFRHPAWHKLQVSIDLIENTEYDMYVYIDTDCIFKNNTTIEEYLDKCLYIRKDEGANITFINNKPRCNCQPTCCFFIFNKDNLKMFKEWWAMDIPKLNKRSAYEETAIQTKLYDYKMNIIDDWVTNESGLLLRHVYSPQRKDRLPYFTNHLDKLKEQL